MNVREKFETGERLYRNRETGVIMGVCSGIAEFFDLEVWVVRVAAVISLYFFTTVTGLAYLVLGLVLKDAPLSYRGRRKEQEFWRNGTRGGHEYR